MKLTEAQLRMLARAGKLTGGISIQGAREANTAERLERSGLIRYGIPGYTNGQYFITDAGRRALEAEEK